MQFSHQSSPTASRAVKDGGAANSARVPTWAYATLLILTCLLPCSLSGQTEPFDDAWRWAHFTTETGLPSNEILGVVESSDGTSWVSTSNGLAWYDNYQWIAIDSSKGVPKGPPERMVSDLSGGILVIYDRILYQGNKVGFRRIPVAQADYAVPFSRDSILVLTAGELLLCSEGRVVRFEPSPRLDKQFPSGIYRTRAGSIWLRQLEGYYAWEQSAWKLKLPKNPAIHSPVTLAENDQGNGLLAVENPSELWEWSRGKPLREEEHERWQFIKAAEITSLNEVILVSASDELRIRRQTGWSTINPARSGIHDITCIASRKNGDLWFGTKNGLHYFKRSSQRWTHGKFGPPFGRDLINEIIKARDHSLWIATGDGIVVEPLNGARRIIDSIDGSPLHSVTSLGEDAKGNVWIGSGSSFSGAFRWNGSGWKYFRVSGDSNEIYVHKIRKDRQGRLWFLGLNPALEASKQPGAYMLDGTGFTHWSTSDGLISNRVYAFAEDSRGRYWFGTVGGVSRWRNGTWWYWKAQGSVPGRVFTLAVDRDDRLWFTDGSTRLLTVGSDDIVRIVPIESNPISGRIMDIAFDPGGTMWLTTINGMNSFDGANWSGFDYKSGLMSPMLWPILCTDRKIYIGTIGSGVATLDLAENELPPPHVVIDHPRADEDGALLRWKALAYWGKQPSEDIQVRYRLNDEPWSGWNKAREMSFRDLKPGNYTFKIEAKDLFGAVSQMGTSAIFAIPRPIISQPIFVVPTTTLSIIAVGLIVAQVLRRRKHLRAIRESEAKFRRLTEATFEGIVIHEKGIILDTNASFLAMLGYAADESLGVSFLQYVVPADRDRILPIIQRDHKGPYELQLMHRGGTAIVVEMISRLIPSETGATGVIAIRDITERKAAEQTLDEYQRQLRELASEVAATELRERQRMAAYLHDTIGQSLAFCKIKLGDVNEPVARENLVEIRTMIEEAIKSAQSLTFELSPSNLAELSFKEAVESLAEEMEVKHDIIIYFEDDKQEKPVGEQLRGFLYQAIRELIVNAIKHGSAHSVEIYLRRMEDRLEIEVTDDGCGFKDNAPGVPTVAGGFGLFSIRERLRHFGGTIDFASTPGDGARVIINVRIS